MGRILVANASSEAANLESLVGIASPLLGTGKRRRVYLHSVSISPRGADFAADTLVYISNLYTGEELVTNGAFAADSGWTKGEDWTIADGVASKATAAETALSQEIVAPVVGDIYGLQYTLVETATGITPSFAGDTAPADEGTGTHKPVIVAASAEATLAFTADATAIVDLDNVSLVKYGSTVNYWLQDSIRAGRGDQYLRSFDTKQPWSEYGWGIYITAGGASCILDTVVVYELV